MVGGSGDGSPVQPSKGVMALASLADQLNALTLIAEHNEGKALCNKRNVTPGNGSLPPIMPSGQAHESLIDVKSNVFPMRVNKLTGKGYVYSVSMVGIYLKDGEPKHRTLTVPGRNDFFRVEMRRRCYSAWRYCVEHNENIFPPLQKCAYDTLSVFYTAGQKVAVPATGELLVRVDRNGHKDFPFPTPYIAIEMIVRERDFMVDLDLTTRDGEISEIFTLERCLDVVVNMAVEDDVENHVCFENNTSYLMQPAQVGFTATDTPSLGHSSYVGVGCSKNVRMLRTSTGSSPALIIETKKTPFHDCVLVSQKVCQSFPRILTHVNGYVPKVVQALKGLVVRPVHLDTEKRRIIQIKDITYTNAQNTTFELDGVEITVFDYYLKRHNITLEYPILPLLVSIDREKKPSYHPMELYTICDNQRVKGQQIAPEQIAALIKVSAVLPRTLERQVYQNAGTLHLLDSAYLKGFGIEVSTQPIRAKGRVLPPPGFMYGNRQISNYDKVRGSWRSNVFFNPAKIGVWACYSVEMEPMFDEEKLSHFAKAFYDECQRKGMQLPEPADLRCVKMRNAREDLKLLFDRAASGGCNYILFVSSKADNHVHKELKACERRFNIITQNVLANTAASSCGLAGPPKRLTMENLVNKANVKMGGLNYNVADMQQRKLVGEDDLFIGFAKDLGAGDIKEGEIDSNGNGPTVIGYAANDVADALAFTGDYIYQEARKSERVYHIVKTVELVLKRYSQNRNKKPNRVFIYRNGVTESNFSTILTYEIPLLRDAVQKAGVSCMVYIVPNKLHNIRLIPDKIDGQKPPEQNLKPGTVVDTTLVSPKITEFFCCGHVARLGTAKIPRYSVLSNDSKIPMDEIQRITYFLCYGHQIVTGATGLPSPVFIARRFAERGRMNLGTAQNDPSPQKEEKEEPHNSSSSESGGHVDTFYDFYNRRLTYLKSKLRDQRFNA